MPNADPPKAGAPKALVEAAAGLEPNAEPPKALVVAPVAAPPEKAPNPPAPVVVVV